MATTNAFCLASPPLARICLHGDLQRFGRRLGLYVNTAAEAIRALSMQMPGFRRQMNEGWYQIRIAVMTRHRRRCTPVFTNSWVRERSSTLCRDWPGPERVDCRLCWGRQPSWALSSRRCLDGVMGYSPECRRFFCHHNAVFTGCQHDTGRCGPDAGPEGKNTGLPRNG